MLARMESYSALIIDLKNSRKYTAEQRNYIQAYIIKSISVLNDIFESSLAKKVEFSAGDEIQGLFSTEIAAYLYYRWFSMIVFPIKIRAGIGIGSWSVVVENAGTTAQDGSAYHFARYAIESTENTLGYSVLAYSEKNSDLITNSLFSAVTNLMNAQSEYQNEIALLSELMFPIVFDNIFDCSKLNNLIPLIQEHSKSPLQKSAYTKKSSAFSEIDAKEIQPQPINICEALPGNFFITDGKTKKLSAQLSVLMSVSRQNIDKRLKAAHVWESRNLVIAIMYQLAQSRR